MLHRTLVFVSIILVFGAIGCASKDHADVSITGENGEKISVNSKGATGSVSISGANGEKVDFNAKNGEMSMSSTENNGAKTTATMGGNTSVTEADLGVPFYPGSTEKPAEQMKVDTDKETDFISARTTGDEPSKVSDFYKEKVKGSTTSAVNSGGLSMAICTGLLPSGAKYSMTAERKDGSNETLIKIGVTIKK